MTGLVLRSPFTVHLSPFNSHRSSLTLTPSPFTVIVPLPPFDKIKSQFDAFDDGGAVVGEREDLIHQGRVGRRCKKVVEGGE